MLKRIVIFLSISFLIINCTSIKTISAQQTDNDQSVNTQFKYVIIPESPVPGEPVTVALITSINNVQLIVKEKEVAKSQAFLIPAENGQPSFTAAIFAIPSTTEPGDAIIRINNELGVFMEIQFTIAPKEFPSETLKLNPSLTSLVTTSNERTRAESARLWQILTTTGNTVYHDSRFVLPISTTRRTSRFGTRRINEYSDGRRVTSIHAGVDFGAPAGTEVYACGRGKVILARERQISGNSIIIEHGPGIYSIYYHLNAIKGCVCSVKETCACGTIEGSIVRAGEIIGGVGSTGFSTGPHLHWELRVSTENTDPDVFVSRPLLDKNLIISKLYE